VCYVRVFLVEFVEFAFFEKDDGVPLGERANEPSELGEGASWARARAERSRQKRGRGKDAKTSLGIRNQVSGPGKSRAE